jgi:hypothetical protein
VTKEELIAEARTGRVTQVVIRGDREDSVAVGSGRAEILVRLKKDDVADLIRQLSVLGVRVMYETESIGP